MAAVGKICIATVLLSLQAANSYILLSANIDDVHALAKQIASSSVGNELNKMIRRAADIFKEPAQSSKEENLQLRTQSGEAVEDESDTEDRGMNATSDAEDAEVGVWEPNTKVIEKELSAKMSSSESELSSEANEIQSTQQAERRQAATELVRLEKNASLYLTSINKIFDDV